MHDTSSSVSREWICWTTDTTLNSQLSILNSTDTLFSTTLDTTGIVGFRLIAVSPEGCLDTAMNDSLLWTFHNPEAAFRFSPERLSMHDPHTQFINLSQPDSCSYLWLFPSDLGGGSTDSSGDVNPSYQWEVGSEAGDYLVSLIAYLLHYGPDSLTVTCTDTATIPVAIVNTYLQFPNVVTPNGDGINDTWVVVNLLEMGEYSMNELWIYNAWGVLVYHVKNIRQPSDFWNPNETDSPDGTYYYRFSAKNDYGIVRCNGAIEVVR
jgi:gliding motility-associated-like protein